MSHYITLDKAREYKKHYENFPVATIIYPKKIREAATLLYLFARQCDDIADEGTFSKQDRLKRLNIYKKEITNLKNKGTIHIPLFLDIKKIANNHKLKYSLFDRFMIAFEQDIKKNNYHNIRDLIKYCDNAANPAGEMILTLFKQNTKKNIIYSNSLCTALALLGISQDIPEDYDKGRIYIPENEMKKFKLSSNDIKNMHFGSNWIIYKKFWIKRIEAILKKGKPLEKKLKGRLRLQIRILIKAAELLIKRTKNSDCDLFNHPPKLSKLDWVCITLRSIPPL
jgi:hydroxysqualene synthase